MKDMPLMTDQRHVSFIVPFLPKVILSHLEGKYVKLVISNNIHTKFFINKVRLTVDLIRKDFVLSSIVTTQKTFQRMIVLLPKEWLDFSI